MKTFMLVLVYSLVGDHKDQMPVMELRPGLESKQACENLGMDLELTNREKWKSFNWWCREEEPWERGDE